jgi:hypothetical protein
MRAIAFFMSVILLAAANCGKDSTGPDGSDPAVLYHASTHPDSVVANFVLAWEARDLAGYRDQILYDGTLEAPDGEVYQAFKFYFAGDSGDPELPDTLCCDEELAVVGKMFAGQPGMSGTPGIKVISMTLEPFAANWQPPGDQDHVEDDPYPPGTLQRYYSTDILIELKSEIPGTDINAFVITDRLWFHVIPVQVGNQVEYRVWKWRDILSNWRTQDACMSQVKVLYQ